MSKGTDHGFQWLSLVVPEQVLHHYYHVIAAGIVGSLLVVFAVVARFQLSQHTAGPDAGLVPEQKLTIRNFFEIMAEKLYGLCETVMGRHGAEKFFPVIGTLFVYVLFNNLLGLIPGVLPATDNLNTTLALGAFVFIYYNLAGLRENGLAYLKHFLGPVLWLGPLMVVIELASHLFRPLSLALRLRGNIMGDHVVLGIFNELAPWFVPMIFDAMGAFVSFIQAFVFCLMTMVYISLSTAHDH